MCRATDGLGNYERNVLGCVFNQELYLLQFQFLLGELLGLSEFLSLASEKERNSADKAGRFRVSWRSARDIYSDYWAASLLNVAFNELLKTLVAEPRPHFLDTCKPDWAAIDCTLNKGYI